MCFSTPGQVVAVDGELAEVETRGHRRWYNALPAPGLEVGDWVYTQAGLVLRRVGVEDAMASLAAVIELERAIEAEQRWTCARPGGEALRGQGS